MPVVLPPLGDAAALLDRLDGICLSGGPDLDPDAYGAAGTARRARPDRAVAGRIRAGARPRRRRARDPDPRHLSRRPGTERRPRRHPAPAPAGPPPDRARHRDDPHRARRGRHAAGVAGRHAPAAGELVPPPGRGRSGARAARGRACCRRDDRGGRGRRAPASCWPSSGTPRGWWRCRVIGCCSRRLWWPRVRLRRCGRPEPNCGWVGRRGAGRVATLIDLPLYAVQSDQTRRSAIPAVPQCRSWPILVPD